MIFADIFSNPGIILIFVLLAAGLICLIAFLIKRFMKKKNPVEEEKKSELEIADEEINRILVPIEDEDAKKQIEDYKESEE